MPRYLMPGIKWDEPAGSGEQRLMQHLSILYSQSYVTRVREELAWMRERHMEADAEKFSQKYKHRFCDLSLFVKELKERFSRWFNKKHERRGTLWMDRFKSVLVENGEALQTMSTYIDLNPVRAGLVEDPKDYRWCGYAEAVGGSKQARRGLCMVMAKPMDSWLGPVNESGALYRCWLMLDSGDVVESEGYEKIGQGGGDEVNKSYHAKTKTKKTKKGIPRSIVDKELARAGRLSRYELLMARIQAFSEGGVIGTESFVNDQYQKHRGKFGPSRKKGARLMLSSDSTPTISSDAKISKRSKGGEIPKTEVENLEQHTLQDSCSFYTLFRGK